MVSCRSSRTPWADSSLPTPLPNGANRGSAHCAMCGTLRSDLALSPRTAWSIVLYQVPIQRRMSDVHGHPRAHMRPLGGSRSLQQSSILIAVWRSSVLDGTQPPQEDVRGDEPGVVLAPVVLVAVVDRVVFQSR